MSCIDCIGRVNREKLINMLNKHKPQYDDLYAYILSISKIQQDVAKNELSILKSIATVETKRSALLVERNIIFFSVLAILIASLLVLPQIVEIVLHVDVEDVNRLLFFVVLIILILVCYFVCFNYRLSKAQKLLLDYEFLLSILEQFDSDTVIIKSSEKDEEAIRKEKESESTSSVDLLEPTGVPMED